MNVCWHRYDRGKPIARSVINGTPVIKLRKECEKCGKCKEAWRTVWVIVK